MASLFVTFRKGRQPGLDGSKSVARGADARSESLTIGTVVAGSLVAQAGEDYVELEAGAECWVAIGPAPVAVVTQPGTAHHMAAGATRSYYLLLGDKVSVITA